MKTLIMLFIILTSNTWNISAQEEQVMSKKWGAEFNVLWPIFPGNIYKGQITYEIWRDKDLAGDVFAGITARPFEFREEEGDFSNYALTFGYRQFVWKGLHAEVYQAVGPGFNRNNAIDGKDYTSWDYEVGLLAGYRWEFWETKAKESKIKSIYLSTQHGFYYVAAKSNPHPIKNFTGEEPIYVGTLNIGILF